MMLFAFSYIENGTSPHTGKEGKRMSDQMPARDWADAESVLVDLPRGSEVQVWGPIYRFDDPQANPETHK